MINTEIHAGIALVTFDDGKVNALNQESLSQLESTIDSLSDAKAVVLTGGKKCFSAGLDMKKMVTFDQNQLDELLQQFNKVVQKILRFPRPFIAAVNGHAIAGGAVMTLCCDHVVGVNKELKIGLSEVAVGMPLPSLVVELARHRLNPKKLNEAVLFGNLYNWDGALNAGYFNEVTGAETLKPRAIELAGQLGELPQTAFAETKKSLLAHLPSELGAEAVGAFLTDGAQQHMAKFKG